MSFKQFSDNNIDKDFFGESQTLSNNSIKNNKNRLKSFKNLSTKDNTLAEHLFHYTHEKEYYCQTPSVPKSQKWGQSPEIAKKQSQNMSVSCKIVEENPFHRAKQNLLEKQKTPSNHTLSGKSIEEETGELQFQQGVTTMRILKRGSLNVPLRGHQQKQV